VTLIPLTLAGSLFLLSVTFSVIAEAGSPFSFPLNVFVCATAFAAKSSSNEATAP